MWRPPDLKSLFLSVFPKSLSFVTTPPIFRLHICLVPQQVFLPSRTVYLCDILGEREVCLPSIKWQKELLGKTAVQYMSCWPSQANLRKQNLWKDCVAWGRAPLFKEPALGSAFLSGAHHLPTRVLRSCPCWILVLRVACQKTGENEFGKKIIITMAEHIWWAEFCLQGLVNFFGYFT